MSDHVSDELLLKLADLLESAGVYRLWEQDRDRLNSELYQRETRKHQDARQAKLEAFQAETGGLNWPEYAAKYSLLDYERRAAEMILPNHRLERGIRLFVDQEPTADQRQRIAHETTLSKRQACELLDISPGKFDKLKKQHKLEHVGTFRAGETSSGFPTAAYLYRLSDIKALVN